MNDEIRVKIDENDQDDQSTEICRLCAETMWHLGETSLPYDVCAQCPALRSRQERLQHAVQSVIIRSSQIPYL